MSIIRKWVTELGLREQGVLVVSTRGCDVAPKFPLDSPERRLTAAFRCAILVPFDEREVDAAPGCFMISTPPLDIKLSMFEHYPLHWVTHAIHAMEVLGFNYPETRIRQHWEGLYKRFVKSLHLTPETKEEYLSRLNEDRISTNSVVSI